MTRAKQGAKPSDLDLMSFVDGELEAARRTDVQSWLDSDPVARRKVAALELGTELVRERKVDLRLADGIADAVMARIASGDLGTAELSPSDAAEPPRAPDKVVPLRPKPAEPAQPVPPPAANDNARRIYYLAAAAVAAAAALMVWGRGGEPGPTAPGRPITAQTAPVRETPVASSEGADESPSPDGDLDPGVEVAAVDFGARQGSIFYVPNGAAEARTTTVVWLADDSGGDE